MFRLVIALSVLAAPAAAQLTRPPQWHVRFDRAGVADSTIEFVGMPPGWHITTQSGAFLYDPAMRVAGSFRAEYESFLFPGTALGGHGLFVGGRDLDGPAPAYVALLVSRDGRFTVERRDRSGTHALVAWRRDTAVTPHPGGNNDVRNVLAVDVDPDSLGFMVNGTLVARVARPAELGDHIGLRVSDSLNVHVSRVSVMWGGRRRR
jgi:hypothetical protein